MIYLNKLINRFNNISFNNLNKLKRVNNVNCFSIELKVSERTQQIKNLSWFIHNKIISDCLALKLYEILK